ncbi:MAG: hypothetical protein Q4F17_00635 [Eubacteriales bacterium]|nr:hypothetical protein [Eubacteriales bacterium]
MLEQTLYTDHQAARPRTLCPICLGEVYDRCCLRCQRRPTVTLEELSKTYEESAQALRLRLRKLRAMHDLESDPEEKWHLKRRIAELTPMLTQMNELADLTAHYYDRGYYRSEKYTL